MRAIGCYLGSTYREAEDRIVHNLRTAFGAPHGTLAKLYLGNDWKPEEVVSDAGEFFSPEDSQQGLLGQLGQPVVFFEPFDL